MHGEGFLAPVLPRRGAVRDLALAVVEQRPVDEPRPDAQDVDQLVGQAAESPGLVGVHHQLALVVQQPVVEIDHALHERRREGADAAVVEQVDAGRPPERAVRSGRAALLEDRVVAEVRVAVDHAVVRERIPPRLEHRLRDGVAIFQRRRPCSRAACGLRARSWSAGAWSTGRPPPRARGCAARP